MNIVGGIDMIIRGANLEAKDVTIKRLTQYNWTNDEEMAKTIKMIEDMYLSFCNQNTPVESLNLDDDGKVLISRGMINHRCDSDIECLRNISKYGVLASEWFGELESEREGCFCTFISKMKGSNYLGGRGDLAEDDDSRLNIGKNIVLFFDESNEIMRKLLHLDYFEYEHIKELGTVDIKKEYSENEIKILEFIEELSPSGKNMRHPYDNKTNYWSAIPGGIPSFLINGICIKRNNYSEEQLDEINSLFPNATIFNNERSIKRNPLIEKNITNKR